jgi:hypothetical protein
VIIVGRDRAIVLSESGVDSLTSTAIAALVKTW